MIVAPTAVYRLYDAADQRADGIWQASVQIGYSRDGRRLRKTFSSKQREIAERKLNDYLVERATA